ncbi:MAG TPA: periplasmic heavy metal sensor [Candidatus Krumholzibacteriaceae bacterium]|nr:periplasmic heavy metal sensor [Candidatus Krumholzibacteriaceae bacterium]
MNRNKLTVLVIISLAFNVAVLAVFGYFILRPDNGGGVSVLNRPPACPGPRRCRHFARKFGLHPEKTDSFVVEMSKYTGEERKIEDRIAKARIELIELLQQSQPDEEELMLKVDEISSLQNELEKILVRRLLQVNSLLSKSEKERFNKLLFHRMGLKRTGKHFPRVRNIPEKE